MKEAEIQAANLEYLQFKRRFFWRNNAGAFKTEHGSFIRFGVKGAPDIIGCVDGKFVGLEVKTAKGKISPDQGEFARTLQEEGGDHRVVWYIEDIQALGFIVIIEAVSSSSFL